MLATVRPFKQKEQRGTVIFSRRPAASQPFQLRQKHAKASFAKVILGFFPVAEGSKGSDNMGAECSVVAMDADIPDPSKMQLGWETSSFMAHILPILDGNERMASCYIIIS